MRVLIDTNIFIYREDNNVLPDNLQELLRLLSELKAEILIHPLSVSEIYRDKDEKRKGVILSKIKTYRYLESPIDPDPDFVSIVGVPQSHNERVDNALLFSLYKNAIDFLVTEDRGIYTKSKKIGVDDRVFNIEDGLVFLKRYLNTDVTPPPAIQKVPVHNLDIKDPFFDSLKKEYGEFEQWFNKISREGRKCWVYYGNHKIGALLIYKIEEEAIDSIPPLPKKRRLKISTMKVSHTGYKIGELFIKLTVNLCVRNNIDEMYLTHFTKENDLLIELITEFGFYRAAVNERGEEVYLKKLKPDEGTEIAYQEICKKYYPSLYDGRKVNKFVIPIRPEYHDRLFTDYKRQSTLPEYLGQFIVEGNTIKKAYLSHSRSIKINSGDVVLFYRSGDMSSITALGVVERVYRGNLTKNEIMRYVGKRSVYTYEEIKEMAKKPTLLIFFSWHFYIENPLILNDLIENDILRGAPQSITEIDHDKYLKIKERGGIDGHFTFD